ncbi:hypothetical protein IFM61392_08642 [Aspergillus lentulus]|uniref:Uncharacterized protein n=1 Tax=Aspergillus lentulus TaxID=293939 RepID=A0AAN5YIY9_ASPLE|nr:hypothetical protein CNMCM8927_000270 [Aspergillus lentulus]GFG14798.1 hypothetical protein IFM61392_08642 [Aspergillus lentulus]
MAFLTGLSRQANLTISKSALMAISQVETSHNIWSLLNVFNTSPFSDPADTVYPYANQILDTTNAFVVPARIAQARPGSKVHFVSLDADNQPRFEDENEYYAVFHHELNTVSVPFDRKTNSSPIPERFDPESSITMVTIADRPDAPTEECRCRAAD